MQEIKYLPYALVGFSFCQLLGILITGFSVNAAIIPYLIICICAAIPSYLSYGGQQSKTIHKLPFNTVIGHFVPFFIIAGIATFGLVLGVLVGL